MSVVESTSYTLKWQYVDDNQTYAESWESLHNVVAKSYGFMQEFEDCLTKLFQSQYQSPDEAHYTRVNNGYSSVIAFKITHAYGYPYPATGDGLTE
eukprot:scaffold97881_cov34-Prasinocladus_malaysianus.AAC.1